MRRPVLVPARHPPELKVGIPREGGERLPRPCLPGDCGDVFAWVFAVLPRRAVDAEFCLQLRSRGDPRSDVLVLLTPVIFSFSPHCLPSRFVLSLLLSLATAFLFSGLAGRELHAIWGHWTAPSSTAEAGFAFSAPTLPKNCGLSNKPMHHD